MGWEDLASTVVGAVTGAYSANKAASAQKRAAAQAGQISERQYQQTREDMAPGRQLYGYATNELGSLYFGNQQQPFAQQDNPATRNGMVNWGGNALARFGRGGDTTIAHLTPGETVVPQQIANRLPGGRNALMAAFQADGADPNQYTVGGPNSINPRTGLREFKYGADTREGGVTGASGGAGGNQRDPFGPNDWQTGAKYGGAIGGIPGAILGGIWGGYNQGAFTGGTPAQLQGQRAGGNQNGGYGGGYGSGAPYMNGAIQGPGVTQEPQYGSQADAIGRFYESPDYKINFDEGARTLEQSAAARGGLFGGNTGTALVRYGQDYGNRLYNQYANRLQSFAGLGQTAAAQTGQFGAQNVANQGNALYNYGQAGAQGWEGINNAIQGGLQNYATYRGVG